MTSTALPRAATYSFWLIISFSILLAISIILILTTGETPWHSVWQQTIDRLNGSSNVWNPLLDERLPRLIVIICSGASLSVAGAVTQALFLNHLASPNVLGISSGGTLLVVLTCIFGWHIAYPFSVPLAAFVGCLTTLILVYNLSRSFGEVDLYTLLLTGIAISSLLFAIQAAIMYALRDNWMLVQTLTEWEAGSTIDRDWKHVHMQLPLTIIGLYGCWYYRSEIDILALGEEEARNLGVAVNKIRWRLFLCVALLTGGAIAAVGMIAFFGLVLPHLVRHIQGPTNYRLIPLCLLVGSAVFAAMDVLLRLLKIHALSIGNVAAILGGIAFLVLLRRSRRLYARGI